MAKVQWKPGTMLNPVPPVLVSSRNRDGKNNIMMVAWAGTVCSDPPMLSVSIRPERHSYEIIKETGEFAVNLTTEEILLKGDMCGVKSGRNIDKFREIGFTPIEATEIKAPLIGESPINLECKVKHSMLLGSHEIFIAEIVAVHINEELLDENGRLEIEKAKLVCYSHGHYYSLKEIVGHYGYSVKKPTTNRGLK